MFKLVHEKNNVVTDISEGKNIKETIRLIYDRDIRYKLICDKMYHCNDGSVFKIIQKG